MTKAEEIKKYLNVENPSKGDFKNWLLVDSDKQLIFAFKDDTETGLIWTFRMCEQHIEPIFNAYSTNNEIFSDIWEEETLWVERMVFINHYGKDMISEIVESHYEKDVAEKVMSNNKKGMMAKALFLDSIGLGN
jgi:hypothetical protein